ncbi:hypothetical protein KR038_007402 [Drosophila bunnanda]|nr:hypothetical protein KR038_007402 [Drosophila bunnanda]
MPSPLSLLLLLPLRCRRNCNQIASLAILLLSALSAKIHEDQVEQRRAEAEEEGPAAGAGAEEQKLEAAGLREGVETDPDRDTPYIATKVANPHPIRTSSGITSARGTGTGAALTSWQSSHSHRSPGANSSAQDQEQFHIRKEHHLQLTAPSIVSRRAAAEAGAGTAATLTTKPAHRSRVNSSRCSSSTNHWLPLANCSWTAGLGGGVAVAASIAT